jgi:hypothetical protein
MILAVPQTWMRQNCQGFFTMVGQEDYTAVSAHAGADEYGIWTRPSGLFDATHR